MRNYLWIDQYGDRFHAPTQTALKEVSCIPGKVTPMYVDKVDGGVAKVGVVIGKHWFTQYARVERPA